MRSIGRYTCRFFLDQGQFRMTRIAIIHLVIFGFIFVLAPMGQAHDVPVYGVWETEGGKSQVQIYPCDDDELICGRLVWTPEGKRVGEPILSDFSSNGSRLSGGRIHDPRTGKTYKAKLEVAAPDELKVKGCWFVFCGSQSWTRVSDDEADQSQQIEAD